MTFAVVAIVMFGILAAIGAEPGLGVMLGIWVGAIVVYVMYRQAFFAESVLLKLPGAEFPYPERIRKTAGRQRILPEKDASYLSVEQANELEDEVDVEARVIGIYVDGHAIAYPLAAMGVRQVAHEVLDGRHIFITWWPVTYSARAFIVEPRGQGDPVLLPSPKTLLNSAILADGSENEIVQFLGQVVTGPQTGHTFKQIPVVSTNWRAWSSAFPDTEVMSLDGTPQIDIFEKYYTTNRPGLHPQSAIDKRWHDKDTLLGVVVNDEVRSYPHTALIEQPLINDELGREPILVALERMTATAVAFSRVVDGRTLTFSGDTKNPMRPELEPGEPDIRKRINYEPWILVDSQTGSRWSAVSGECISGELAGKRLHVLAGQSGFWYAWSRFYPNADTLQPASRSGDTGR